MKYEYFLLSGGGLKGLSYIGVLDYIETHFNNLNFVKEYVGCSIGSFFCLLFLLGYKSKDLKNIVEKIDLNSLKEYKITQLFDHYGMDNGFKLEKFLKVLISTKLLDPCISMAQLYEKYPVKITFAVTNINLNETEFINKDTYPDIPVYLALKMSMCLPLFFNPVCYKNRLYVDGGITSNFPLKYFYKKAENDPDIYKKILAFSFNKLRNNIIIENFYEYIHTLFKTVSYSMENTDLISGKNKGVNIILIDAKDNQVLNTGISKGEILKLYCSGFKSTECFFKNIEKNEQIF